MKKTALPCRCNFSLSLLILLLAPSCIVGGNALSRIKEANRGVNHGALRSISDEKLRIDFTSPPGIMPEGANGSPISSYTVEVARGRMQKQILTIVGDTGGGGGDAFTQGGFKLELDGNTTACIDINQVDVIDNIEQEIKQLDFVASGSTVEVSSTSSSSDDPRVTFEISFGGDFDPNVNHNLKFHAGGDCAAFHPPISQYTFDVQERGIPEYKPEVVSVLTYSDDFVGGYFDVSVGFEGENTRIISVNREPILFEVDAGSRIARCSADVTNVTTPGDSIVIQNEKRKIKKVESDHIVLDTYHEFGTGGEAVYGYSMDNIIGVASIETGDQFLTEINGNMIEVFVEVGDYVKIMDGFGTASFFQVASKSGDTIQLATTYGGPPTTTSIWIRKRVSIPSDASKVELKQALESLPEIGVVSVDRRGPSPSFGYEWLVTLDSNGHFDGCPESCLIAHTATLNYITVSGLSTSGNGDFVQGQYLNGRPRYNALASSHVIQFDPDSEKWEIRNTTHALSEVQSNSTLAPLSGWSSSASLTAAVAPIPLLHGVNSSVAVSTVSNGIPASFENIVYTETIPAPRMEVQNITVSWTEGPVGGFFYISFRNTDARVKIACDDSAKDVSMKLELLPSIGSVVVTKKNDRNHSISWIVTFLSNIGDLEMLSIDGEENISGVGASIEIIETTKGTDFDHMVDVSIPRNDGEVHVARIAALNAAGKGEYSDSSQNGGGGMRPFAVTPMLRPGSPQLSVDATSNYDIDVRYTPEKDSEDQIYKLEWSESGNFGEGRRIEFSLQNSLANDMFGTFQVRIKFPSVGDSEATVPISVANVLDGDIAWALNEMKSIRSVIIEDFSRDKFGMNWTVELSEDVGVTGDFELITDRVMSASGSGNITATVNVVQEATVPEGYDFEYIYSNECSSLTIGESSPLQYISLTAENSGQPIGAGSYKLAFGNQASECISFNATADVIKAALLGLDMINDVDVVATQAPISDQFPFNYVVRFNDLPVNDQWGALRIDQLSFGSGDCEAFNAGNNHQAVVFSVKERKACAKASPMTQVLLLKSTDYIDGSFDLIYGGQISEKIPVNSSAHVVETALKSIIEVPSTVEVVKKENFDSMNSVAWVLKYLSTGTYQDEVQVNDNHVTGGSVRIFPMLNFTALSIGNDMSGDVRLHLGNEVTGPISLHATNNKILYELHYLEGVGNIEIIGSGDDVQSISLSVIVDNGMVYSGAPAFAVPGDYGSMLAKSDKIEIGSCTDLIIDFVQYEQFDGSAGAGSVLSGKYNDSSVLELSKSRGLTILGLDLPLGTNFTSKCAQIEGDQIPIQVGQISYPKENTVERLIVVKEFSADLNSFSVVPDPNWRGTRSQIFAASPFPTKAHQFIIGDKPEIQRIVFRDDSPNVGQMFTLSFHDENTTTIIWPSGDGSITMAAMKYALDLLNSTKGIVEVSMISATSTEYVFEVKFFGHYKLSDISLLSSAIIGGGVDSSISHTTSRHGVFSNPFYRGHRSIKAIESNGEQSFPFRISAKNERGHGMVSETQSVALFTYGKVPDQPRSVALGVHYTSSSLSLHFQPPRHDGGEEVTKYLVECDSSNSFASTGQDYFSDEITYQHEIQEITLSCTSLCSGSFTLGWGGRNTQLIDINTGLGTVAEEISKLLQLYESGTQTIDVTRTSHGFGMRWLVTFGGVRGDIGLMDVNDEMLVGVDPMMTVEEITSGSFDIYPGSYTNEVQSITVTKKKGFETPATGWFTVSFEGDETSPINVDASARDMKEYLEALETIKKVSVHKSVENNQSSWQITFADLGHGSQVGSSDIDLIRVETTSFGDPSVTYLRIFENVKGTLPMTYSINGLSPGQSWYCRVSSYNALGYGKPSKVVENKPRSQPGLPTHLNGVVNHSSLSMTWDRPNYDGGSAITGYYLDWYARERDTEIQQITLSAADGISEVQVIRTSADSNSISGYFTLTFKNEVTEPIPYNAADDGMESLENHLRRLPSIGDIGVERRYSKAPVIEESFILSSGTNVLTRNGSVDVSSLVDVGQMIFINEASFSVQAANETSLTLDATYNGTSSNEATIYKWAFGYEWYVTFTSMVGSQPLIVASPAENWAGVNPSILVKRVVKGSKPLSGTFQLMFGKQKTRLLPYNSDANGLKTALEELQAIREVEVSTYPNNNGHNYIITFSSEAGDLPLIEIDASNLHGPNARAGVSTIQNGKFTLPGSYGYLNLPSTSMSATISGLQNGTPYTVRLSALNSEGAGIPILSNPSKLIPMNTPSPPTNVQLISMSDSILKFVWEAPDDAGGADVITKYLIQWDISSDFPNANLNEYKREILIDGSNELSYCANVDINPDSLAVPRFGRVMAFNGHAWSEPGTSTPSMVYLQKRTPGEVIDPIAFATSSSGIMVEWSPPDTARCMYGGNGGSPITHYVLEWDEQSDFSSPASSAVLSPDTRSYHLGGRDPMTGAESSLLSNGGTYFLRITAFNSNGSGLPTAIYHRIHGSNEIGPLSDSIPSAPILDNTFSVTSTSMSLGWNTPKLDGGSSISSFIVEHASDLQFEHSSRIELPVAKEFQSVIVDAEDVIPEVHRLTTTVEVTNEIQSVRTSVDGVDEIQTVTTTCDDVIPEVQAILLTAEDGDEIQTITPYADDIDEIQLVRISGDDEPEIQGVTVTVPRSHEVQNLGILISNINTNGANNSSFACYNASVGDPCQEIEDALNGTFTVSFEFDKCGGSSNSNFCQHALSTYDTDLGIISCSPGLVSNPMLGGDHCVSQPIHHNFSAVEGDLGTLQWALNTLVDDNGRSFMTSSHMPNKQTAVTVTRSGMIKTKGLCPLNNGVHECVGEYEISYTITFDAEHSTGDVPPITIVHSDLKVDENSMAYSQSICPLAFFPGGCVTPIGTAMDSDHGNFYDGSSYNTAVESTKGSQPTGMVELDYECESLVQKLGGGYAMTSSLDGYTLSFNDTSYTDNAAEGQWLRFAGDDGIDIYRKISSVNSTNDTISLHEPVQPSLASDDVEFGFYFSDWQNSDGSHGVSDVCLSLRTHRTLPIDITTDLEAVSSSDWKEKIGALSTIDSTGLIVTRHLLTDLTSYVGFQWQITFAKQPGNVNQLICYSTSGTNSCSVTTIQEATLVGGDFQLGTTWPHEYVAENPTNYTSLLLHWNIGSEKLKNMLESVVSHDSTSVFGDLDIVRTPYVPGGHIRWSGGYTWTITFASRPGNIPALNVDSSALTGSGVTLEVSDEDSGLEDTFQGSRNSASFISDPGVARDGNQVSGSFALSWFGNFDHPPIISGDVFMIQKGGMSSDRFMALSPDDMKDLLTEHIFSNSTGQVIVTRSTNPSQVMGYTYTVQFIHEKVGGDVPLLSFVEGSSSLHGQNVGIQITEQSRGNEIRGTFQLHFLGQTTGPIRYDATAEDVEDALNGLSSISPSAVTVSRTSTPIRFGPPNGLGGMSTQVGGNIWSITFSSHVWKDPTAERTLGDIPGNWFGPPANDHDVWESGFSKGWGKNVGDMPLIQCISSGLTTTKGDFPSDGCQVSEMIKGTEPLSGNFKLCLDTLSQPNGIISVLSDSCTDEIAHNAVASAIESGGDGSSMEEKLEALENVGDVLVTRSEVNERNGGYTWTIQFLHDVDGPCQQRDSFSNECNAPGDVPKLCDGVTSCESSSLGGSCKSPGMCSKLTVLDATDFTKNVRPPSGMERQKVIVKDAFYSGWDDGSHVNIPGAVSEYKLNINGTETPCIQHNASATSIQAQVQSVLDGIGMGKVVVDRIRSEAEAPNGFVYFLNFYEMGNMSLMIPLFSNDTSICTNYFDGGKEVEVEPIFDGSDHSNSCHSCRDGIVQRGNITVFEVENDTLSGELVWNANSSTVKSHLEQKNGRKVEVEMDYLDKYGSCEWTIRFISNPDALPPGASDVSTLNVQQNPDSSGKTHLVTITEVVKGSNGMSGSILVDYGSPRGALALDCDEPPSRLQLKLNELNVVGQVFVTRDCYPTCSEGGWGDNLVNAGTHGGYVWHIHFVKNPGGSNGFSFPPGSGNINLPSVSYTNLVGSGAIAEISAVTDGSQPVDGSFKLSNGGGVFTDAIPYNSDSNTMKKSLNDLPDGGDVSVYSGLATNKEIPNIIASVALDGISLDLQGDDVRKYLAPGDAFRLISDNISSNSTAKEDMSHIIGTASISAGSPLMTNTDIASNPIFVGEKVRIRGGIHSIARNGIEVQQITIHSGLDIHQNSSYTISVFVGGVNSTTNCLPFNTTGDEIQDEINNLGPVGPGGVKVTASAASRGIPGDPHVFKIYYIGENILGNVDEVELNSCQGPGHGSLPYASTRTLINGGRVEHQRISLSADSGDTDYVPALKLNISDSNFESVSTSCIEWGAESLGLAGVLDGAFSRSMFNVGAGGITKSDTNIFQIDASDYIEGKLIVGDRLQIDGGCIGTVIAMGQDGKSVAIVSSTTCSGSPGDAVHFLPDTSIVEVASSRQQDYSTGLIKIHLSSREPVSPDENIFRLEITFQGVTKQTQCYPYGVVVSDVQSEIDGMFDYDGNGVIDNDDQGHILVSRVGDGGASSMYGYTYSFKSIGSRSLPGISKVLGSNSPQIEILGFGSGVGCADVGGVENLITSSASTVNSSTQVSNVSGTDHLLRSGSRIRISGSSDSDKIYVISHLNPLNSTIFLTEPFDGVSVVTDAKIYTVEGAIPFISSKEIELGTNEYNYDVYFIGTHWQDVPLMTINKFGDGTCLANNTQMSGGMSRNLEVSTVQNGGGNSDSMEYVLDSVVDFTGETTVRLVPPLFRVRREELNILRVIVKDEDSSVLWSSGQPAFKILTSDQASGCIDYDSSEDSVESALELFCVNHPGCVTVSRNVDAVLAPNGYIFSIHIKGDIQTVDFNIDSTGCSVPFSSGDGESAVLEIVQGHKGSYTMSDTKMYLANENDYTQQERWIGNDNHTFSLYRVTGTYWTIKFNEFLGNKPQLTVASDSISSANVTVNDSIMAGNVPLSATISDVKTGVPHFARVYARNKIGISDSNGTVMAIPGTVPPQIKDLRVQNALYSNEVQSISIVASHISEIQVVETSAVAIPEVQEVIIDNIGTGAIQNGHFSLRFPEIQVVKFSSSTPITAGSFYLQIEYVDLPASIVQGNGTYVKKTMKTPCIPLGSRPEEVKDFMEGSALQDGFEQDSVEVSMSGDGSFSSSFGYEYTIKFVGDNLRGNLPLMQTDISLSGIDATGGSSCEPFVSLSNDATIEIDASNDGDTIGSDTSRVTVNINADGIVENGQFAFSVSHLGSQQKTSCIEWNAEAVDMENALEALLNVDSVRVQRKGNGRLSNDEGSVNMHIKDALFLIGDSSSSISLSGNINSTISDFIHVGDRLQFEGQLNTDLFFTVLSISGNNATLDKEVHESSGLYEATSYSNYQYIIHFDGQGLHPHKDGASPFIPSENFTISTISCDPFETFVDNVLTKYDDSSLMADVYIGGIYDGGSTLPLASKDKVEIITNTMKDALSPSVSSISTLETWEAQDGSVTYTLTFGNGDGNLQELVCNAGSTLRALGGKCSTFTVMDGNMISGHFYIGSSGAIQHDASAQEMESAIEQMPSITDVEVSRESFGSQGGYRWFITYIGAHGDRGEPMVSSSLSGKHASVSLEEFRKGNTLGGTYQLMFNSEVSDPISFDADESALTTAIEKMNVFHSVTVTEITPTTTEGGRLYHVTFIDQNLGDIDLLEIVNENLSGIGATVTIREELKGRLASAQALQISFTPPSGCSQSQVQRGICGNDLTQVSVQIASDPSFTNDVQVVSLLPDQSVQIVRISLASFAQNSFQEPSISGSYRLKYGSSVTDDIAIGASASDVRDALESLSPINTISVTKDFSSIKFNDACIDLSVGSSLAVCGQSCTCNFGSNGLQGNDLILLDGNWYRVSSTYDGDENEFIVADVSNSLVHYDATFPMVNEPLLIWGGGFEWRITFHSVQEELHMLTSPKHNLFPEDSFVHIDTLDCIDCLTLNGLEEWRRHYVRIRSSNKFGWGYFSNPVQAVSKSLPDAPSEVSANVLSSNCIEVSLTPPEIFAGSDEDDSLDIIVEWDVFSDFRSNHHSNYTCSLLSYGHCQMELNGDDFSHFNYEICGLSVGTRYYVRVAAKNAVEIQLIETPHGLMENLKWSSIQSAIPQDQVPDAPQILTASSFGQKGVQLVFNPPSRDGGQSVTHYTIIWDEVGNFSSPSKIDVPVHDMASLAGELTNVYTFQPSPVLKLWKTYYIQLEAVNTIGSSAKSASVSFSLTTPPRPPSVGSLITAQRSVEPITHAMVSWAPAAPTIPGELIEGYLVEWWSKRKSPEIQTVKLQYSAPLENTEFSLSFTLSPTIKKVTAMMPWNATASILRRELINLGWSETDDQNIIDNIEVSRSDLINGYMWTITFGENEHGVNYGNQVTLRGDISSNGDSGVPVLSTATIQDGKRPGGSEEVQFIQLYGTGDFEGFYQLSFGDDNLTPYIAHNATAAEIEYALELLPLIRDVGVTQDDSVNQLEIGSTGNLRHHYEVTFLSTMGNVGSLVVEPNDNLQTSNGDSSIIIVDGDNDVNSVGFKASTAKVGEMPVDYQGSGKLDSSTSEYTIEGLVTGREYFVAISTMNSIHGYGERMLPSPVSIIPPIQSPLSPQNVTLTVNTGFSDSLLVSYFAPPSDGGDNVLRYRVELDPTPNFDNPIVQEIPCPTMNKRTVWRVETKAQGGSIINGGSFSLKVSGNAVSYNTAAISYDAVALAQNETGIEQLLDFTSFTLAGGNATIFSSTFTSLEGKIFAGDRVRFSNQTSTFKNYVIDSVQGYTATLTEPFDGTNSSSHVMSRHYGGRGNPSTSRIYCEWSDVLCSNDAVEKSGSMQKKLEEIDSVIAKGILVDRDGPTSLNEFIWRITFLDNAPEGNIDFAIQPLATFLTTADGINSATVLTTLLTDGETYNTCTGTMIVPKYGGLVKGLEYYARVSAINSKGYSIPANALEQQAPIVVPGRPTSVSLDVVSASELRVMFASPIDNGGDAITRYLIEWDTSNSFANPESTTIDYLADGSPFFKTIDGLTMGQYYFVRVSAWNSEGYGAPQNSSPPSLNPHQPPNPPANVQFAITSDSMLTVGWSPPLIDGGDEITTYRVEWDTTASFTSVNGPPHKGFIDVDASVDSSYTIQMLSSKKVYFVRVFAVNTGGMGPHKVPSDPLYLTPANQVPGKVRSLTVNAGSLAGYLDVHWQRPMIPHHDIPCSGTLDNPVACPTNFGDSVTVSNGGEAITEYEVEYNERADFGGSDGGRKTVSGTFTTLQHLTSGREYYIRVLARNIIGSGAFTIETVLAVSP